MKAHEKDSPLNDRIEIIDCTLRDGEQAPGVWFNRDEKLALAQQLSEAGVDVLDAGFPANSEEEIEIMQQMAMNNLSAKIGATARPIDRDIKAAAKANAEEVFLFMPTSDLRLERTLGLTRKESKERFTEAAFKVAELGMGVNIVFEDATRADIEHMFNIIKTLLKKNLLSRVIIADTVGCGLPHTIDKLFRQFKAEFNNDIVLCPHCHNDFGLATANTLSAVNAGAKAVTCTVNALGERAGNACLLEVAAALTHLLNRTHNINAKRLYALSKEVERTTGIYTSALKPVSGFNVYRHESGIHVDGMLKDKNSYEYLPSQWTNRKTEYVLGKHSGTALIKHILEKNNLSLDNEQMSNLLDAIKNKQISRTKISHYEAYETHCATQKALLSGVEEKIIFDELIEELK